MYYPYYEWILHGWYSENWLANVTSVNCSKTDLLRTIDRAIAIEEYSQVEVITVYCTVLYYYCLLCVCFVINTDRFHLPTIHQISLTPAINTFHFCLL